MLIADLNAIKIKGRLVRLNILQRLYTTFGNDLALNRELDELDAIDAYIQRYQSVYGYMTDNSGNITDLNLLTYIQRYKGIINRYQTGLYIALSENYQQPCDCKYYPLTYVGKYILPGTPVAKVGLSGGTAGGGTTVSTPGYFAYLSASQTAYTSWAIPHNLTTYPAVVQTDLAGHELFSPLHYDSVTTTTATFSAPQTGYAYATGFKNTYQFIQGTPSSTWQIPHNLGKFPFVLLIDRYGYRLPFAPIQYVDANNINISFATPFQGTAYLIAGAGLVYNFFTASTTWTAQHSLGRVPLVTAVDQYGNVRYPAKQYTDLNNVTVTASSARVGQLYIN